MKPTAIQSGKGKLSHHTRLAGYSLLAGALLASAEEAQASIEYLEIDSLLPLGGTYEFDFDGDGINDAAVGQGFYSSTNVVGFLDRGNVFVGYGYPSYGSFVYASALPGGVSVGLGGAYVPNMYVAASGAFPFATMNYGNNIGAWVPAGPTDTVDAFLGLEFMAVGGTQHYAWIRCKVISETQVIVVAYGWETDAGVSIITGDTGPLLPPAGIATTLLAADVADNNSGDDLELMFAQAPDESTVAEYRAIAVKAAAAGTFDLAAAEALASDRFVSVTPAGIDPTVLFGAGGLDADGDAITGGNTYTCFVLSMAEATTAIGNSLSDPSNDAELITAASLAVSLSAEDFADAGDASDMRVRFEPAVDEGSVSAYRVLVVDSADAASFDQAAAEAVIAANYTELVPNGAPKDIFLDAAALDVTGSAIMQDQPYAVFVLSIADGSIATINALSPASTTVTLRQPVSGLAGPSALPLDAWLAGDQLQVSAPDKMFQQGTLRLYTLEGRIIEQWPYTGGSMRFAWPSEAALGHYLLIWDTPAGLYRTRLAFAR